jgi:hypothetical protein
LSPAPMYSPAGCGRPAGGHKTQNPRPMRAAGGFGWFSHLYITGPRLTAGVRSTALFNSGCHTRAARIGNTIIPRRGSAVNPLYMAPLCCKVSIFCASAPALGVAALPLLRSGSVTRRPAHHAAARTPPPAAGTHQPRLPRRKGKQQYLFC